MKLRNLVLPLLLCTLLLAGCVGIVEPGSTGESASNQSAVGQNSTGQNSTGQNSTGSSVSDVQDPTSSVPIEAHDHNYSQWSVIQKQTCIKPEVSKRTCACGIAEAKETKQPSGVHTFGTDGKCAGCGLSAVSEVAFVKEGEAYTVTGLGDCRDKIIVLPDTYQELPVTKIQKQAFFRESMDELVIPDSVTHVGEGAFAWLTVRSVTIPSTITVWGDPEGTWDVMAFCLMLEEIHYQGDLLSWLNSPVFVGDDRMPDLEPTKLYLNEELLTDVVIPESVTSIKASAFCGIGAIKSVRLPAGVVKIGAKAFQGIGTDKIQYSGTMKQWEAIEKAEGWDGATVRTVQCSDGEITL